MDRRLNGSGLPPIGVADEWTFLNGPWHEGEECELVPPEAGTGPFMAVAHQQEYADFQAQFRFRFRWVGYGGARFVFRLQDATRYYALDIPWSPQQCRCRYVWAGIVVADGTPLQRYLKLERIPEITPQYSRSIATGITRGSNALVRVSGPGLKADKSPIWKIIPTRPGASG